MLSAAIGSLGSWSSGTYSIAWMIRATFMSSVLKDEQLVRISTKENPGWRIACSINPFKCSFFTEKPRATKLAPYTIASADGLSASPVKPNGDVLVALKSCVVGENCPLVIP